MSIPVIIDTDPGIDDAIALMLAVASPEIDLLAVTTVGGNVGVAQTTRNALDLLAMLGRADVPVGAGAARPLVSEGKQNAAFVHGDDGLGGLELPTSITHADPRGAIGLLRETINGSSDPVTVIAIGPLTNLAVLQAVDPDTYARIGRIVLMGGGVKAPLGNTTPTAEFNIWFDAEAASRVFTSGVPITMVGLDVTSQARIDPKAWSPLLGGGPIALAALRMVDFYAVIYQKLYGSPATAQHDSLAVAAVCRPDLLELQHLLVDIECAGTFTRGMTVAHFHATELADDRPANVDVALGVDVAGFTNLLIGRVAELDARISGA